MPTPGLQQAVATAAADLLRLAATTAAPTITVAVYHPAYHPTGCYGCGAAVGAVAGMAVGAAIASTARPATVVVAQPAYVAPQPVYVAQGNVPIGTQYAALPSGAQSMVVNGVNYYQSGPTWYKPYFGSSGVYYEVVPAP